MSWIFYTGIALTLIGLTGILRFVQRARRLKRRADDEAALDAELRSLVVLNLAAFVLAFFGLAVALVGLILAA